MGARTLNLGDSVFLNTGNNLQIPVSGGLTLSHRIDSSLVDIEIKAIRVLDKRSSLRE